MDRPLQGHEAQPHQHRGRHVDHQRPGHVEAQRRRPVPVASKAEPGRLAPIGGQPGEQGRARGEEAEGHGDGRRIEEQPALAQQEDPQRPAEARQQGDPQGRAGGEAGEVEREHGAEGEGGGLHRHLGQPEPEDLEAEGDEAAEAVEGQPDGEVDRHRRRPWREGGFGRRGLDRAEAQDEAEASGGPVSQGGGLDGPRNSQMPHEQPGRGQGAQRGAHHVGRVEPSHRAGRGVGASHEGAHHQGQRHPHERRGGQQGEKVERRARQPREPCLVERHAGLPDERDHGLERGEQRQRLAGR